MVSLSKPPFLAIDFIPGVHVSVNQQTAVIQNGRIRGFEQALDAVRFWHAKTETDRNAIPEPLASSSAKLPLTDSGPDEREF